MKNKKKSFYFEDYTESEISEQNKPSGIKVSLNRVTFLSFIFFSLLLIFSIKMNLKKKEEILLIDMGLY